MEDFINSINQLCDTFAEVLDELKCIAEAPEELQVSTDLVEALDRLDMYLDDEARSTKYYYRLLIAKCPKYRELLEEYTLEVTGEPYKPDFVAGEEKGHIYIIPLDK